ncbi:MAG TPA: hypothetical protein VFR65_09140 [Nitrososphaeraceae archaeon]|jgi:hypothetical protein|nr:hypothetical protein [Nitrososphaeraceae archaeon]HSL13377.1 hypothetical protein [Nitrososphaeraceae archaeon]
MMSKGKSKSKLSSLFNFKEKFSKNKGADEVMKCKECNMEFNTKDRMNAHKKIAHSGKGDKKKKSQH